LILTLRAYSTKSLYALRNRLYPIDHSDPQKGEIMKPIDLIADQKFLDSEFKGLQSVTLYLLSTGRNAWHTTWSAKYQKNAALFSNFEAAKNVAEESRIRGTTFKIAQYPGLAFLSTEGVVALVEFHSSQPFNKLRIEDLGERLAIGTPIRDVISPFTSANSEFWNSPFPSPDSFVDVKTDLAEEFQPLIESVSMKKWKSVASGSNYYLGWQEQDKPLETPISKIMMEFGATNALVDLDECEQELESARKIARVKRKKAEEDAIKFKEASINLSEILEQYRTTSTD